MALTGTFLADFSSFQTACANAEVSLKGFESGAGKVETSLNKMADSLSGTKIVQQATIASEAVERIGGISKLTEAELTKVGATAQQAAEKLRAMGQDVPKGIQQIADAAKQADEAHKGLSSTVKDLVISFGALFTARSAFNFVSDLVADASALRDLSNQTHIGTDEIQVLAGAMSEFGVDAETLGKGLYGLSRRIAGQDDSVAGALHAMGMSFKDVEGLNGKELFLKIEDGLSTLQGGLKDTTAAELFGSKLGAAMAGASEGAREATDKWQRLNHVISEESINAMDQYGESIARAEKGIKAIAADLIGPLAQGFNTLTDATDKGAKKWDIFVAMVKDFAATNTVTGASTSNLTKLLDDLNQKTDANTKSTQTATGAHREAVVALDAHGQAVKFMASLELDAAAPLLEWQREYLQHLKDIGQLTEKNAAGIGVSANQFKAYQAAVILTAKSLQDFEEAQKSNDETLQALDKATFDLRMDHERQLRAEQQKRLAFMNDQVVQELDAQAKLNASYGLDVQGRLKVTDAAETLRQKLDELQRLEQDGIDVTKRRALAEKEFTDALYEEAKALTIVGHGVDDFTSKTTAADGAVHKFAAGLTATNEELSAFYDSVARGGIDIFSGSGAIPAAHQPGPRPIKPWMSDRDSGGPVTAGVPYLIGKGAQPELFVPSTSGTMFPNTGGGTQTINVVVDGRVLASVVNDYNMRSVKSVRKLGSA